ncbi:hypothetical protein JR316_0013051 [Psilocybe cubensis]|uniref:F-box domain-containing protein n=2 Tax=Psilocybe cubensis TaxID=181762 RepID=A0A8H7XQQ1_PSICU|nr:hypothetical protein JR316_0013051 [Psilocybe cubensis]KAH9474589.1 hypothetical protein JR316_0013051 [Psilocybe cubensis]
MDNNLELVFKDASTIEDIIMRNQGQLAAAKEATRLCREKHYRLSYHLNKARSVLSSLPNEVISQIFLFMCAPETSVWEFLCFPPTQFLIGSVCKEWRQIAWSTPHLWDNIEIQLVRKSCETQIELLEEWIERSGNLPLDIHIYSHGLFEAPWEAPPEAFTKIAEVYARWRSYHGHAVPGLAAELKRINATCFPMLETLSLSEPIHAPPVNNPPDTTYQWNFLSAPALHNVLIEGPLKGVDIAINWGSLTCLTADFVLRQSPHNSKKQGYVSFHVLTSCTLLTKLELNLKDSRVSSTQQPHPCRFPHLKILKIEGSADIVEYVLEWLTTPSLNELQIRLESIDITSEWEASLIDLTTRSSCKIRSLSVIHSHKHPESDDEFVDMLRILSRDHPIDSLEIRSYGFTMSDNMVLLLTMQRDSEEQQDHLPLLKNFTYAGDISFSLRKYADMINSRLIYEAQKSKENKIHRRRGTKKEPGDEYAEPDKEDENSDGADQLDNSSASTSNLNPLNFSVSYENLSWFGKQRPCILQSFYKELERASTRGKKFDFKYGQCWGENCDDISSEKVYSSWHMDY